MQNDNTQTTDTIDQIVIEVVIDDDTSLAWEWNAFSPERRVCGGSASTLSECLDSMRTYLRNEGIAP